MITLISFGFKYHRPPANNYIDVSFIKNPARQEGWNLFSPIDKKMADFVRKQEGVEQAVILMANLIEHLGKEDDDMRFAFGCSAGRHRSPVFVCLLKNELRKRGLEIKVKHLELECGELEI